MISEQEIEDIKRGMLGLRFYSISTAKLKELIQYWEQGHPKTQPKESDEPTLIIHPPRERSTDD